MEVEKMEVKGMEVQKMEIKKWEKAEEKKKFKSARRKFHKYPNRILVESGTYEGDGIQDALDCGFEKVISFEITVKYYKLSSERFKDNPNVTVVYGSTVDKLWDYIKDIEEPITFFLDGHYSFGFTGYDPDHVCPVLKELEAIGKHKIKSHTIMIDDRRLYVKSGNGGLDGVFNILEKDLLKYIFKINNDYDVVYEDGHAPEDIIVAYVKDNN